MNAFDFDPDRPCPTYRVDALNLGDQIWSPASRWETVTGLDAPRPGAVTRVNTDLTGPDYGWALPNWREIPVLPVAHPRGTSAVWIQAMRDRVLAFVGTVPEYHRNVNAPIVAQAIFFGRGRGWEIVNRPDGGESTRETVASKATAVAAVRRSAKAHAKALRLPMGRAHHPNSTDPGSTGDTARIAPVSISPRR
jgi:hypothetical protein